MFRKTFDFFCFTFIKSLLPFLSSWNWFHWSSKRYINSVLLVHPPTSTNAPRSLSNKNKSNFFPVLDILPNIGELLSAQYIRVQWHCCGFVFKVPIIVKFCWSFRTVKIRPCSKWQNLAVKTGRGIEILIYPEQYKLFLIIRWRGA